MINVFEVRETNKMIEESNLDVRTITMGISLLDCCDNNVDVVCEKIYRKITEKAANLVKVGEQIELDYGIPIVNKRISVTPIALVGGSCCKTPEDYVKIAKTLDRAAHTVGINFLGGYSALVSKGMTPADKLLIESIPQADLDAVKVEQLNTRQKRVELTSSRMAYLKMLSLLMGEVLSPETVLEKPVPQNELSAVSEIRRPELSWFDAQGAGLQVQEKALNVRHLPHFGLFVQGAYGNPGLNMLKNEFSPYYIAGVRLSWNFGSLYTLKNDRRVIENKRQQLDSNRDVFLFNTRLEMTQQDQSVRSLEKQMQDDDEIIRLRTNIRRAAEAKVANGTLTVTEMLRELTNESLARQAKAMHEIQRLMGIYQLKYTTNH